MEDQGKQSKLRTLIKEAPPWISIIISIGGMVFALGVMYNNVESIKGRMDKMEDTSIQMIRMEGNITNLQTQIKNSNDVQQQTAVSVNNLSAAVSGLGSSVSNLQGKLETMPPARHSKHR